MRDEHNEAVGRPSFGALLRRLRQRAGLSQNALAKRAGLDASAINRLERGERGQTRREAVEALAAALALAPAERDQLLAAGGHLPASLARLGLADPTLLLVADVLADERIPAAERAEFRELIRLAARRWRT
jgi:transcriptional regulator with XRE-family HTH domain